MWLKKPICEMEEPIEDSKRVKIRQELSNMSFEELQKLKEKLGSKTVHAVLFGKQKESNRKIEFRRDNKNRPRETSSKTPVKVLRTVIKVKKKVCRDPRFDDLSGTYNEQVFRANYSFINELKTKEMKVLEKQLKDEEDPIIRKTINSVLQGMMAKELAEKKKQTNEKREKCWRQLQIKNIQQGKKPYFIKKSDKKKLELAEKYETLKKSGKLEKYLMRKRKKNAVKDRKKLQN